MNIHLIVQQILTCTTVVHVYACHGENTQVTPLAPGVHRKSQDSHYCLF